MHRFKLERSKSETYTDQAGLILVGACLNHYANVEKNCADIAYRHGVSPADVLRMYIGILCQGKSDFEAVENVREDSIFKHSLGIHQVLSASRFRQRVDEKSPELLSAVERCNIDFLQNSKVSLTPLATGHIAIDADVSPFNNSNSKKEHTGFTYKGFDGYSPTLAYIGEEGWGLEAQLRPGPWHSQFEFKYVMEQILEKARKLTNKPLLLRLDSGYDAIENRKWLAEHSIDYIIKSNQRTEPAQIWMEEAKRQGHLCVWEKPRHGKRIGVFTVYVEVIEDGKEYCFRRVVRVTERTIDKEGNLMLFPAIEVDSWWTSLDVSDAQIIALYKEHATSEQYHSELKTDLDLERFPSGKFNSNDLILNLGLLSYNILKWIGLRGLLDKDSPVRHSAKRRRVKTVMQELIGVAARWVEKGRQNILRFGKNCIAFPVIERVYADLLQVNTS